MLPLQELIARIWLILALLAALPTAVFLVWLLVEVAELWNKV